MQRTKDHLTFSPSDLCHFLDSEYVTWMDRFVLEYPGTAKPDLGSETEKILQQKGMENERAYLKKLKADGVDVYEVPTQGQTLSDKVAATTTAMRDGRQVIYQAALQDPEFAGYVDFLVKTPGDSSFGNYHYEPWDTKLALSAKPYFLIQLSCYADLLSKTQGRMPLNLHIVLGDQTCPSHTGRGRSLNLSVFNSLL